MASLLKDPSLWKDQNDITPPGSWNGTAYAYVNVALMTLTLLSPAVQGDTVDFSTTNTNPPPNVPDIPTFDVAVNGVSKASGQMGSADVHLTLAAGDTVVITMQYVDTQGCGYLGSWTLTPIDPLPGVVYDCSCDDTTNNRTLATLRKDLLVRLGYAAQAANPPPGMVDLLNSFLIDAQEQLYRRYDVLRTERFFTWNMQKGVRFYDLPDNVETCTKKLDAREITWIGVEHNGVWYPLQPDIRPELYSFSQEGFPSRYEIRSCIEVWPAPSDDNFKLRIKGRFGLEAFAADADKTTIDDRLVFLLALANAKAHYRHPDAGNYVQQLEVMMMRLVAGLHQTRRYIPDKRETYVDPDPVYIPLGTP